MKRKLFALIGLVSLVLSAFSVPVNALSSSNGASYDEDYLERNWARVELATKVQNTLNDEYNIQNVFNDTYPSYFGGMYISDDAKNLIIQVVKNNVPTETSEDYSIYQDIINMDSSIKIEYVTYSFNELNDVNNYISDNMFEESSSNNIITSSYLDIMNNAVGVELENNTEENQENVKNAFFKTRISLNPDLIRFTQTEEYSSSANINAGGKILLKSGETGYCSMGMRINYNGNNGYLTAGHCATGYSSFPSGTIQVKQFADGQKYDYAFVKTNSSYIPTNTLAYGTTGITKLGLINYCPTITVNMAVAKAGVRTGYTTGKVTGLNVSVTYSDVNKTIKGMIKTNVYQGKGDSGGVVMIPRTDANGGAIGLGILSGGIDLGNEMYFSDLNVLPIALQNRY